MAGQPDLFDWSSTPLGPKDGWSPALLSAHDIIMASHFAMCVVWGPERFTIYNPAFVPVVGKRHPAAVGQPFHEIWSDVWSDIGPLADRAMAGETIYLEDLHLVMTRNGYEEDTWWTFCYSPILDGDRIAGFLDVAIDTTEKVQTSQRLDEEQARLRERESDLRALNRTLEARVVAGARELMAAEDQVRQMQKLEAIGQLTGGVAHDFNNLLTVIRSSAELLRRPELPEERRLRYLDAISVTAERAAKLTSQLLAFARRQALKPEVFDPGERVKDVADMLRTVVGARVQLSVEADSNIFVEADASQFETAIVNMAVNARDAMEGEGQLMIEIQAVDALPPLRQHGGLEGPFVTIRVTDSGAGMSPEVLEHIFEPFFTTKDVGKGTGLGLSQVYGFAKQSGGDIEVASALGEGAAFTMYLPRVEASPLAVFDDIRTDWMAGNGRVLVVEDNTAVGEFATQLLQDLGFQTQLATNAATALAILEADAQAFDVVFSDVVMPGASGVELGRRIRERWPRLPIVLTSGYSHVLAEDAKHGFELLQKPYSAEELSRVLRAARC